MELSYECNKHLCAVLRDDCTYYRRLDLHVRAPNSIHRPKQFYAGAICPSGICAHIAAAVSNPSDNLRNLFELLTVFYALVLCLYVTNHVDATFVWAAWLFVGFRVLHSGVHCTFNFVPLRFWLYAGGSILLWFIAVRAALALVW